MRVDRDLVPGRRLDDLEMMFDLPLAVVPLHAGFARRIAGCDDPARVGNITGLDGFDAKPSIQPHRIFELRLINGYVSARLVMTDQRHALALRIIGHRREVEIRGRLGKAEFVAMAEPVSVPALVPAFDQNSAEPVFRGKIDIVLGPLGRGAVLRPLGPAPVPADHAPPDPDIFHRLHPTDVPELVRLVQVEFEVVFDETRRRIRDPDRPPWRREGQIARDARSARRRRQGGAKLLPFSALEPHARIVDQRGLVKGEMRPVVEAHGQRRVRRGDGVDRRFLVDLLIAVPFAAGNPPGRPLGYDVELGEFVGDMRCLEAGLFGQLVAEADAVVEKPEAKVHRVAAPALVLPEPDQQFVVHIADEAAFAPRLLPTRIGTLALAVDDREAALQSDAVRQDEPEFRGRDEQLAPPRQRPCRSLVAVGGHRQNDAAVGRGGGLRRRRRLGEEGNRGERNKGGQSQTAHHISPWTFSQSAPQGGRQSMVAPLSATTGVPTPACPEMSIVPFPRLKRQRR